MSELKVLELTIKLQQELEKMSEKEFKAFMKGKALKHNGKLYGLNKPKKKEKLQ